MVWFFVTFATGLLIAVASSNVGIAVSTVATAALEDAKTLALRCLVRTYRLFLYTNSTTAPVPMRGPSIDFPDHNNDGDHKEITPPPKVLRCYVDLTTTSFPVIPSSTNADLTQALNENAPTPVLSGEFTSLFHFALKDITKRANELQMMVPGEYVLAPCYEVRRLLGVDGSCDVEVYFRDDQGKERAMMIAKLGDALPQVIAHPIPLWRRPSHTPLVEVTRAILHTPECDISFPVFGKTESELLDELLKHCRRWIFIKPASREEFEETFTKIAPRVLRDFMFATGGLDVWRDAMNPASDENALLELELEEQKGTDAADRDEQPLALTLTIVCNTRGQTQLDCFSHTVFL